MAVYRKAGFVSAARNIPIDPEAIARKKYPGGDYLQKFAERMIKSAGSGPAATPLAGLARVLKIGAGVYAGHLREKRRDKESREISDAIKEAIAPTPSKVLPTVAAPSPDRMEPQRPLSDDISASLAGPEGGLGLQATPNLAPIPGERAYDYQKSYINDPRPIRRPDGSVSSGRELLQEGGGPRVAGAPMGDVNVRPNIAAQSFMGGQPVSERVADAGIQLGMVPGLSQPVVTGDGTSRTMPEQTPGFVTGPVPQNMASMAKRLLQSENTAVRGLGAKLTVQAMRTKEERKAAEAAEKRKRAHEKEVKEIVNVHRMEQEKVKGKQRRLTKYVEGRIEAGHIKLKGGQKLVLVGKKGQNARDVAQIQADAKEQVANINKSSAGNVAKLRTDSQDKRALVTAASRVKVAEIGGKLKRQLQVGRIEARKDAAAVANDRKVAAINRKLITSREDVSTAVENTVKQIKMKIKGREAIQRLSNIVKLQIKKMDYQRFTEKEQRLIQQQITKINAQFKGKEFDAAAKVKLEKLRANHMMARLDVSITSREKKQKVEWRNAFRKLDKNQQNYISRLRESGVIKRAEGLLRHTQAIEELGVKSGYSVEEKQMNAEYEVKQTQEAFGWNRAQAMTFISQKGKIFTAIKDPVLGTTALKSIIDTINNMKNVNSQATWVKPSHSVNTPAKRRKVITDDATQMLTGIQQQTRKNASAAIAGNPSIITKLTKDYLDNPKAQLKMIYGKDTPPSIFGGAHLLSGVWNATMRSISDLTGQVHKDFISSSRIQMAVQLKLFHLSFKAALKPLDGRSRSNSATAHIRQIDKIFDIPKGGLGGTFQSNAASFEKLKAYHSYLRRKFVEYKDLWAGKGAVPIQEDGRTVMINVGSTGIRLSALERWFSVRDALLLLGNPSDHLPRLTYAQARKMKHKGLFLDPAGKVVEGLSKRR